MMNSRVPSSSWLAAFATATILCCSVVGADSHTVDADAMASSVRYVIKVTPTLAYLDVGSDGGATLGEGYVVLREQQGRFVRVGRVTVIRLSDSFSIAEIDQVEPGEEIAVLQRVVSAGTWEELAPQMEVAAMPDTRPPVSMGKLYRSITLLGGADLAKDVDLRYTGDFLRDVDGVSGGAIGLRLAKSLSPRLRAALTYRLSGEALGAGDVTQLSIEADGHILFRGIGRPGPYVGLGIGFHQLSWDSPGNVDDTTYKSGVNLMGGIDVPVARGIWSLLLEAGYQRVASWDDLIDGSNVRAYAGLSRNF